MFIFYMEKCYNKNNEIIDNIIKINNRQKNSNNIQIKNSKIKLNNKEIKLIKYNIVKKKEILYSI